jgi:uncharacterized protein
MQEMPSLTLWPWALLIGIASGALVQRSHFCTMGCISDAVLFGSYRRLRVWGLAAAVAVVGSQTLDRTGLIHLGGSVYQRAGPNWLPAAVGGVLFGFGMVQAGGCISRNLARLGSGSLKALVALMATALAAAVTWQFVPPTLAVPAMPVARWGLPAGIATAAALLAFCLLNRKARPAPADLATGAALGVLVPLGWLATGLTPGEPESINYLALDRVGFTLPLIGGTLLGAFVTARLSGEFRIERFTASGDLRRHLLGGALMGCGGALALGCTVGQGLSGVSALAPGSFLALAGMLTGGWWGVKYLETGRLLPRLRPVGRAASAQLDVAEAPD